jgi:hypothetical protein
VARCSSASVFAYQVTERGRYGVVVRLSARLSTMKSPRCRGRLIGLLVLARVAYQKATRQRRGATEFGRRGAGADESKTLWFSIERRRALGKVRAPVAAPPNAAHAIVAVLNLPVPFFCSYHHSFATALRSIELSRRVVRSLTICAGRLFVNAMK